jgi:predicted nucleic acid-binding protein
MLALAAEHGGRFVTFDRRIDERAVSGASHRHFVAIE